jgi:hypothetical protein
MRTSNMELSELKPIKITLTILWVFLILVFGFGGWMTAMELRAQDHTEKLTILQQIDKRLYRIETKMGIEEK